MLHIQNEGAQVEILEENESIFVKKPLRLLSDKAASALISIFAGRNLVTSGPASPTCQAE